MSPVSEVLQTPFQSAPKVLRPASKCSARKITEHFEVLRNPKCSAKCSAVTDCGDSGFRGAEHYSTSKSYFYQKREMRMEQEQKTHVYRGEFMAALRTAPALSEAGR
jgi:hypothetical protein